MNESKRSFFMRVTKKAAIKEIKKREELSGRKLNRAEIHEIIQQKAKGAKRKLIAFTLAGTIGIGAGAGITSWGMKALNPGIEKINENKEGINLDLDSTDKDITINNMNTDRSLFVNGLKVDFTQDANELRENVVKEVDELLTQDGDAILDYIKEIYANEYNEIHDEKISAENVSFRKNRLGIKIYKDENGICRACEDFQNYTESSDGSEIYVSSSGKIERIANYENDNLYYNLYEADEIVNSEEDSVLLNIAELVDKGIDLSVAKDQEGNSKETMDKYKERFINAIVKYKEGEISQIIRGSNIDSKGIEPGE